MAQPVAYVPTYNFSTWEAGHPGTPAPGSYPDTEYGNIKITTDQIRANLLLLQEDDGRVKVASIGRDQLKAEVVAGINTPTGWLTATAYSARDSVINGTAWYWCTTIHTSGVFATDLGAGKWTLIYDFAAVFSATFLSNAVPATLGGAATAGVSAQGARADHVHTIPAFDEGGTALLSDAMS